MINFQLKNKAVVLIAAVAMFGAITASSSAALLDPNSELSLFGTYTPNNGDLTLATELSFANPGIISIGVNDLAAFVGGPAFFNTFSIDLASPTAVFSFGNPLSNGGGQAGSFTATSIDIDFQTASALDLTMQGFWSLDGFDDTLGELVFTADSQGGLYTFSASGTVQPIPVPAAVWLFGSALAALGLTRRRTV